MDIVTLLRVGTMIVFLAVFAGIGLYYLFAPRARTESERQARQILDDRA
jgi:cbb3-type cytochrome oxidase subunit 3